MFQNLIQIDPSTLDFSKSADILNRSKRFVLPVPALPDGGEELRYPSGHPKQGTPIYTNKDGSVQKGIVFANATDSAWQGVQGNGKEAIIINDLTPQQARCLLAKVREIAPDISTITPHQIQEVLSFARAQGLVDMFDKDLESIAKQMRFVDDSTPSPSLAAPSTFLGYMEVSKDTVHKAARLSKAFAIQGPVLQQYPNGGVVVTDGRYTWGLDSGVCERNWVLKSWTGDEVPLLVARDIPEISR